MAPLRELRRRGILPIAGVLVATYYLLFFLPLARKAASLDEPLRHSWRKLAASVDQTNATTLDFLQVTNHLNETRQALLLLESAKKKAASRLELTPALRDKLTAPFQLVDFQNERSKQMDNLDRKARELQVVVEPAVYLGFPEHTADLEQPALLWPGLALTQDLLNTALQCKIAAIHSLEISLSGNSAPALEWSASARWAEIAVQAEFTATADNALKLLQSLPLKAEEIQAAGLPAARPDKSPLYIARLIIRKQNPEKLDEVRFWLKAVGFVLKE